MLMDKVAKTAKVDEFAAVERPIRIGIAALKHLAHILQSLQDGAFAGAVGTEQQRDGRQLDTDTLTYALEVFQLDGGQARRQIGAFALAAGRRVEELEEAGQRLQRVDFQRPAIGRFAFAAMLASRNWRMLLP